MHRAVFTGNGAYGFANALHVVWASADPRSHEIPEPRVSGPNPRERWEACSYG
jgi:hypothetical protein